MRLTQIAISVVITLIVAVLLSQIVQGSTDGALTNIKTLLSGTPKG
ncbi:MAG: hypothetical protein ABEJ03_00985 [Candidatus Nanohaloarchaea archaeon]